MAPQPKPCSLLLLQLRKCQGSHKSPFLQKNRVHKPHLPRGGAERGFGTIKAPAASYLSEQLLLMGL